MQKVILFFACIFFFITANLAAQDTYIIEGDTLQLQREVKGPLSLFWFEKDHAYRYFVQKGKQMVELKKEKFKEQLAELTPDTRLKTRDVKFVLYSLRHFINTYNSLVKEDYEFNEATDNIKQRIGLFVGLSNNKYTENPDNVLAPIVGLEYEFYDPNLAPRHSAFIQLRQSFKQDEYRYSSTQLSINYRLKLLYFKTLICMWIQNSLPSYSQDQIKIRNEAGEITAIKEEQGFTFTAPFSFGIGSDIQVTPQSFISLGYNDIFSIVLDGNDSFPMDFSVGYKYNL